MRPLSAHLVEQPEDEQDQLCMLIPLRLPLRRPQNIGTLRYDLRSHSEGPEHLEQRSRRRSWEVHLRLLAVLRARDCTRSGTRCCAARRCSACRSWERARLGDWGTCVQCVGIVEFLAIC